MALELSVSLRRGAFALDVATALPMRGITALFGRSGSGKTTLLRCIAGLERLPARVRFNETVWQDERQFVPAHRRSIGYVFQEPSLFPQHDVRGNLRYALDRRPKQEHAPGFDQVVSLLGLEGLLSHRPAQLSGGQRQRVAIARALLAAPQLLLMDEPLSSLDEASKFEILPHLERLHDALSIPVLYVSHSLAEVMRLADDLVLLEAGRILANGPLQALLTRVDLPLGEAELGGTVVQGRIEVQDDADHLSLVSISGGRLAVSARALPVGRRVRVRIDARDVSLALEPPRQSSILNVLAARVLELHQEADPALTLVRLQVGQDVLLARVTRRSATQLQLAEGKEVFAQIKSVALSEH
jgi:molybdate transport system ATP-binding protein